MKKSKLASILIAVIMIAVGVILFARPGETLTTVLRIFGAALLVVGGIGIISLIVRKDQKASPVEFLIPGLEAVAGLIILAAPQIVVTPFPIVIGAIIALYGLSDVYDAFRRRKNGEPWQTPLILSVITVVLGLLVLFHPFGTMTVLVRIIGAVLVYQGAIELYLRLKA